MVSEAISTDVGHYLRNCRRSKAISLDEVARKTKIRTVVLRQIEGDELSRIPATFARGFIRAYAEAVDADVEEALQRYEAGHRIQLQMEEHQSPPEQSHSALRRRLLPALAIFACLIAVTLYLAGRMHRAQTPSAPAAAAVKAEKTPPSQVKPAPPADHAAQPGIGAEAGAAARPEATISNAARPEPGGGVETPKQNMPKANGAVSGQPPAQPVTPAPTDQPDHSKVGTTVATPAEQPAGSGQHANLVLQLNAVALTWLKVSQDDGPPREMILHPDDKVTLQAQKKFNLLIGNAGGIRLTLNDKPVQISGQTGKVVRLQLP
jgi:cytoskeleton protein RodZ